MNHTVRRIRQLFTQLINDGTIYEFWWSDSDPNVQGGMGPPWMGRWGRNCTSSYNALMGKMREEGYPVAPVGGTGDWSNALHVYEQTVIEKNYPPGTFGVTPFASDWVQGHNQMVWSGEDRENNQLMAQSDTTQGVDNGRPDAGWPGPNISYTMAWSYNNIDWPTWMGLIPGVPVIDEFPGYSASWADVILWYSKVCAWWYDCPLILPINCIATELFEVINPARDYSIWDINGYANAVDHDSYGQHQGRHAYNPFPWSFEASAWSFFARMDDELGDDAYPDPDDPRAVAEVLQWTQRSFADGSDGRPLGWNYEERYELARDLIERAMGEEGGGPPAENPVPETVPDPVAEPWQFVKLGGIWIPRDSMAGKKVWLSPKKTSAGTFVEVRNDDG